MISFRLSPRAARGLAMPKRDAPSSGVAKASAGAKKRKAAPKGGEDVIKLSSEPAAESGSESGSESESDRSESDVDVVPVEEAKREGKKIAAKTKNVHGAFGNDKETRAKTLYIGHVPHGFYEDQMRAYFGQFGEVTRLRLSRNKKTGRSKHYAYVEFKYPEVAEVVAQSMDGYLLFESIMKVKLMTPDECHPELWKGANRKFKTVPWQKKAAEKHDRALTEAETEKKNAALVKKERARRRKIEAAGIEYDFPGYAAVAPPTGPDASSGGDAKAKKATTKPAAKGAGKKRAAEAEAEAAEAAEAAAAEEEKPEKTPAKKAKTPAAKKEAKKTPAAKTPAARKTDPKTFTPPLTRGKEKKKAAAAKK